jgi:uncharacterized repeat protein (TIGR01451 family)
MAIAPGNPSILYAGTQRNIVSGTVTAAGVYKSTDAGESWQPANTGMENRYVSKLTVDPRNPLVVYASVGSGTMKTTNGGQSWTLLPVPGALGLYACIALDPVNPDIVYLSAADRVARSVDGGANWEMLTGVVPWRSELLFVDPERPDTLRTGTDLAGVQQITIQPDLSIEAAEIPASLPVNAPFSLNYTVRNRGPFHASGVGTVIQLPKGATGIHASPSLGACSVSQTTVLCTAPSLRTNQTISIAVAANSPQSGAFEMSARVQADQNDPATANNTLTASSTVAELTDLAVAVDGPASAGVGAALTYKITLSNAGPSPATGVKATYQLPNGMTASTFEITSGACESSASGLIACTIGDLASSQSVVLTLSASAASPGTYAGIANITGNGADGLGTNNSASRSTTVNAAASPPPPGNGGGNAGAGGSGGGGALSVPFLLGLLALFARRLRYSQIV